MGDKPSKSHSDDESLPPHLVRTNLRLDGAASLPFSEASSLDSDYHMRSRPITDFSTGSEIASDVLMNSKGATAISMIQSPEQNTSFDPIESDSNSDKLTSPKRRGNSKPTSPVSVHNTHCLSPPVSNPSMESFGCAMLSGNDSCSAGDVSARGHSDDVSISSVEPPSPSTSSTKTVISVIHMKDSVVPVSNRAAQQHSSQGTSTFSKNVSKRKGYLPGRMGSGQSSGVTRPGAAIPSSAGDSTAKEAGRSKLTLGDILHEIENRSKSLTDIQKRHQKLSTAAVADLQFLAQQSRYGTDANVKRRILSKLVECGIVDIIVAVFRSLNFEDCFRQYEANQSSKPGTNGAAQKEKTEIAATAEEDESDSAIPESMKILRSAITLLWNISDKLATFCEQCVRSGIVTSILELLQDRNLVAAELQERNRFYIARGCIGALANFVRMCDDDTTREICRSAGAVRILQQYLRCSLVGIRTKALLVLSYVANESENDLIHTTDKNIVFAVKMLQSALDSDNHYSTKYGYWAVEIMAGINRLACFESNKERLHAAGLLALCVQLMNASCSDDEILVATQMFWILSFNASVRAAIKGQGQYMNVLGRLSGHGTRDEIKRTALSALWLLNYRPPSSLPTTKVLEKDGPSVLMLSHHTSRQSVLRVRNRLRGIGYSVHIDPDLRGCGMESAIDNVNRAAIVMVFMSNRLKNSPACRTELEYAVGLKKPFILVRLHRTFLADGWLTTAFGNLPVTDFVDEDNFDTTISSLKRQVSSVAGLPQPTARSTDNVSTTSSEQRATSRAAANHQTDALKSTASSPLLSTPSTDRVASWTVDEVEKWLRYNELDSATSRLRGVTGELLLEMQRMQKNAPESFYSTLRKELQLDFVCVLKLSRALSSL